MDTEWKLSLMGKDLKETIKMESKAEKESLNLVKGLFMKGIFRMEILMDTECINGQMGGNMMETGAKTKWKGRDK